MTRKNMQHTPLGRLADEVIGYRKDGRPIFPIAGGSTPVVEPAPEPGDTNPQTGRTYTEAELNAERERIRKEEKAKLYEQQESERKRREEAERAQAAFQKQVEELLAKDRERAEAEEKARKEQEEAARRKAEEDMDAKSLIAKKEEEWRRQLEEKDQTWQQRLEQIEQQRAQEQALLAKEREMNELQQYAQAKVREHESDLIPSLVDYIGGNSKEEIDASVQFAIQKSAEIGQQAEQAFAARYQNRGVGVTAAPVGPPDMVPGTQDLTPEQIANMPMSEYAKLRQKLQIGGTSGNRGLFG